MKCQKCDKEAGNYAIGIKDGQEGVSYTCGCFWPTYYTSQSGVTVIGLTNDPFSGWIAAIPEPMLNHTDEKK